MRASILAVLLALLAPAAGAQDLRRAERVRAAMGTTFGVVAYGPDGAGLARAVGAALDEVERLDGLLSHFREDSALSALNRGGGRGGACVDPELFALLARCREVSEWTAGAFDVTVGPLMRAWGFPPAHGVRPTLAEARAAVGFRKVRLEAARGEVVFTTPGMRIDLGGVGKGYAVDRAVAVLRAAGVRAALVNAGGSTLYGLGSPPGEPAWRVSLEAAGGRSYGVRDEALSMSGRRARCPRAGGRRIGHVLDPRTGGPARGAEAVVVAAPDATLADALDNAFLVLGARERAEVAARVPGVAWWLPGDAPVGWPRRLAPHARAAGAPP
jgi:thiamine biosynthesis lipoprotein